MTSLDARVRAAHERGDIAALVDLYREAAERAADEDARGFYLTQAHVYALDVGHPDTGYLRDLLIAMGRETPL